MKRKLVAGVLLACVALLAAPTRSQGIPAGVEALAARIAGELAQHCPLSDPDDSAAFESCRATLFGDSALRSALPAVLLWGGQARRPQTTLRETQLTQLAPETWTGLYAPLFMFNGRYQVEWVAEEKQFVVRLEAAFRNRLPTGQFPYPFWHDKATWSAYQNANGLLLWVQPGSLEVQVAQHTSRADNALLQAVRPVRHAKFDGKWLWTDSSGRIQPAASLFRGLYRAENPYLRDIDRQYRDLAFQLRESHCTSCHTPDNPGKMRRLVLLSTPADAAGEIDRLIKAVRQDRMPMDKGGHSHALSTEDKKWLLGSAEAFRSTVQAARAWEAQAARSEAMLPARWQPVAGGHANAVAN